MVTGIMRIVLISVFSIGFIAAMSGCSTKSTGGAPAADVSPLPNSLSNFDDIELPAEMKIDQKKSMMIKTESFRGGVLQYAGKVELLSLRDYIVASMKNNQWKLSGEASYENILLAFVKPNKTCMIKLEEGFGGSLGKTYMELYITFDITSAKRLNPFGEPVGN
jgi:hypothetical protein